MAKKPDVLAELDAIAPRRKKWFEKASPSVMADLEKVRQAMQNGKYYSIRTVHIWAKERGVKVSETNLSEWLHAKED